MDCIRSSWRVTGEESVFGENRYELLSDQRKVDDTYEGSLSFSLLPLFTVMLGGEDYPWW